MEKKTGYSWVAPGGSEKTTGGTFNDSEKKSGGGDPMKKNLRARVFLERDLLLVEIRADRKTKTSRKAKNQRDGGNRKGREE